MSIPFYHILESNGVTYKKRHDLKSCLIENTSIHRRDAKYAEKTIPNIKMNTLSLPACREIGITVHVLIHNNFRSYRSIHQVLVKHVHYGGIQSVRNSHRQEYTG